MPYCCESFIFYTNVIIIPIISLVGIILNAFCIFVFYKITKNEKLNNHMFKYLLLKSIYDELQFIIQIFSPFYYIKSLFTYQSYIIQLWYIYLYYYAESIVELCSGLLELAATFDCLMTINKRFHFSRKSIFFDLVLSLTFLFSSIFYTFRIYDFNIVKKTFDNNSTATTSNNTRYYVTPSDFSSTSFSELLKSFHTILRDALIVILLIILNIFILRTLKKSIKNKRKLLLPKFNESSIQFLRNSDCDGELSANVTERFNSKSGAESDLSKIILQNSSFSHAENIERKTTIMVIFTGVNYIIGHFPSILFYLPLGFDSPKWVCLRHLNLIFFYISYVTPFFVYFSFNNMFKIYLLKMFKKLFQSNFLTKTSKISQDSYELTENCDLRRS